MTGECKKLRLATAHGKQSRSARGLEWPTRAELQKALRVSVEGVKGKVKEVAGAVTGRDDLRREGEAQQDKADAQREAAQKEAEAASARAAAKASEARQRAEQ